MSRPATFQTVVAAQARMEARLTARRGENLLAMIGVPVAALLFFGTVGIGGVARGIDELLPPSIALALVASGLVNLGIATAYERGYGVLKRLGGAPLGRPGLLVAKLAVVGVIGVAQIAALLILATVLGWRPSAAMSWPAFVLVATIAAVVVTGLGMLLAGALRPEGSLLVANVLFLVAILFGGVVAPIDALPGALGGLASVLPWAAAANGLRVALSGGDLIGPLVVLIGWAIATLGISIRTFRWE
jgi:ABC-2 type transport system permease protein